MAPCQVLRAAGEVYVRLSDPVQYRLLQTVIGQADLDRIDKLNRNITRETDHQYWLKQRGYRAAFVRQGQRIAAYAYGGVDQVGPTAGTTREAALCALGWAINLAAESSEDARVLTLRIPAPFVDAVDAALEAGCRVEATLMIYARNLNLAFDRSTFGHIALPPRVPHVKLSPVV